MASAMMFGTIFFASAALATRAFLIGDKKIFDAAANPRSSALDVKSLPSIYTLLFHSSVFGFILFYAYICEYHPPYAHADKNYDADQFFFLTFLLFVVSFFTWRKHDESVGSAKQLKQHQSDDSASEISVVTQNGSTAIAEVNDKMEVLNRDQTEEWKGWMQFMFLLYHYYHAEDVYNAIRIMITCYVWMTGFGNFSFFYLKADFGAVRVLQMMWRLNFLVLFLCLTQGTTFILYYICLLHTYYFFMVYVTMRIGHEKNHTKWWVRIKMAVLALIIFLVWDCDLGLFKIFHYPFFGETPMQGANGGAMWEWYFRSTLDHWSTYLGMIFALNFPITSLFYRKLEAQPLALHILGKAAVGIAYLGVFYWWVTGPFMQNKIDYNQTNAYFGFIPVYAYIYFRNLTPWLRNHSFDLLHQIGKTTLETYLMQHHIWLTSDAKSLLTIVPGYPKINFLLVTLLYVYLSRRLYQLTLFLRGMMLPDNRNACLRNLGGMAAVISSFCLLAYILEASGILTLQAAAIISLACGYILYQFILDFTNAIVTTPEVYRNQPAAAALPLLIGVMLVFASGMVWQTMSVRGAAKIQLLPETCAPYANDGAWMSLNGCDEGPRGEDYRKFDISTVSTCSAQNEVKVWGWKHTKPSTHCRFKQRDAKSLKTHLKSRSIYFVGDSITRYLYHSFCRQLGMKDAGAYNATAGVHQDIERTFGDVSMNFLWAGFAGELNVGMTNLTAYPTNAPPGARSAPDLVILGGGAWDKLWKYETDAEKAAMKTEYDNLVVKMQEFKQRGIPVVWLTPTEINSVALKDEKAIKINEHEMEIIRALQGEEGILKTASFVIDGQVFTQARTSESYDGVHYPHHVYSAGAQILANAMDWLLPTPIKGTPPPPKQPGAMAHIPLGLMLLGLASLGIVGFDGFMGFSYLASIFVSGVAPYAMYFEAFSDLHRAKNLPPLEIAGAGSPPQLNTQQSSSSVTSFDVEETVSLVDTEKLS